MSYLTDFYKEFLTFRFDLFVQVRVQAQVQNKKGVHVDIRCCEFCGKVKFVRQALVLVFLPSPAPFIGQCVLKSSGLP